MWFHNATFIEILVPIGKKTGIVDFHKLLLRQQQVSLPTKRQELGASQYRCVWLRIVIMEHKSKTGRFTWFKSWQYLSCTTRDKGYWSYCGVRLFLLVVFLFSSCCNFKSWHIVLGSRQIRKWYSSLHLHKCLKYQFRSYNIMPKTPSAKISLFVVLSIFFFLIEAFRF